MPSPPDHPGVLAIRHFFEVGSDTNVACRLHYTYSGTAPADAACVTIATDVLTSMHTNLLPVMNQDNSIASVSVTDLTSPSSGFGQHFAAANGAVTSQPLPPAACVLLNVRIGRRYRGGKCRTYWPLGSAADLATTLEWAGASVTAFEAAIAQVIDDTIAISTAGTTIGTLVNISNYSGFSTVGPDLEGRFRYPPKVRAVAIAPDPFTGIAVNPKVASQRRRNLQS